jgi:hypothetical protein
VPIIHRNSPALLRSLVLVPLSGFMACSGGAPKPSPEPLPKYQSICPEGVEIYSSAEKIAADYHEIALLGGLNDSAETSKAAAGQREQAAELGANVVITGKHKKPKSGVRVLGSTLGSAAQRKEAVLAVFVPADSDRVHRTCGYSGAQLARWPHPGPANRLSSGSAPLIDSMDLSRPFSVAPALDEAALARNPNLRWAMATARRVGIATGFFEGHPGILKVTVTQSFRSAPALEYTLSELWEAYSEHRPYDEPGIIELWQGDAKVGEYRQNGFTRTP